MKSKNLLLLILLFVTPQLWSQTDSCFQVTPILIPPSCPDANDGAIYLTSDSDMPLSYLWEDNSTNASLLHLGVGAYSAQVTDNDQCTITFGSIFNFNTPEPIPDGVGQSYFFTQDVNIPDNPIISGDDRIDVILNIEHSWLFDLNITLISPSGTEVKLQDQTFASGLGEIFLGEPVVDNNDPDNEIPGIGYDYTWSTEATNPHMTQYLLEQEETPTTLPADLYAPYQSFAVLEGEHTNGTWTLEIRDEWGSDDGFTFGWAIEFNSNASSIMHLEANLDDCSTCNLSINCAPWLLDQTQSPTATQIDTTTWNNRTLVVVSKDEDCCSLTQEFYTCSGQLIQTLQITNEGEDISSPLPLLINSNSLPPLQTIWSPTVPLAPCEDVLVDIIYDEILCFGQTATSVCASPSGGTPPYTYSWLNDAGEEITAIPCMPYALPGVYTLITTDIMGASNETYVTIDQPEELILSPFEVMLDSNYNCVPVDTTSFEATGGVPPYNFEVTISDYMPAKVTVTDANGCTDAIFTGCDHSITNITPTVNHLTCHNNNTGEICVEIEGGIPPYTYQWINASTNILVQEGESNCVDSLAAGIYNINVSDQAGNSFTHQVEVIQPANLLALLSLITVGDSCVASVNPIGGTLPYQTEWTPEIGPDGAEFVATVTDANGCTTTETLTCILGDTQLLDNLEYANIFPNPSNGLLTVDLAFTNMEQGQIKIISMLGQVIYETPFLTKELTRQIDISHASAGIYFLEISTINGRSTQKIIIE